MTTTDPGADKAVQALPPLEEALKRAYYYTELGGWRGPEVDEWERWHAVAKAAMIDAALTHRQQCVVGQAEHPIDTFKLYAELRDLVAEAGAVDTMIGRPEVLRSRLADLCDRVGRCTNPRLPPVAAPPAQPQSELPAESERDFLQWVLDTLIELNPSNYDHDDACQCSSAAVEVMLAARARLAAQPPERAAQQEAQEAEPAAWQERTQLEREKWSEWYERSSGWSLARPCEIESGGIKYQFRPLYASPPRAVEPMPALTDEQMPKWQRDTIDLLIDYVERLPDDRLNADHIDRDELFIAARGIGKQGQG